MEFVAEEFEISGMSKVTHLDKVTASMTGSITLYRRSTFLNCFALIGMYSA